MVFTDRFIKLPIEIVNKKEAAVVGNENANGEPAIMALNPFEIAAYREDHGTEEDPKNRTVIELKSGEEWTVNISFKEFENRLNAFGCSPT